MNNPFEEELGQNAVLQSLYRRAKIHSILVMDKEGYILHLNETFQQTYGYTLDQLSGQHGKILFTEEDRLKLKPEQEIITVMEQGSCRDRNYVVHQNGSILWSDGESLLIEGANGTCFIFKIIQNVHEQKVLEQTLQEANRFSECVVDSISDGLVVVDRSLRILKATRGFYEILEGEDNPVEGRFLPQLRDPFFSSNATLSALRGIFEGNALKYFDFEYEGGKGTKNVAVQTHFVFKDHEKTKLLLVFKDVTLHVHARRRIEAEVVQRTEQLNRANLALTQANEQLQRSNINLSQFSYAASHDLKEPVRKIHLFASHLKNSLAAKFTASDQSYFGRMEAAAQRMSQMIDALLSYTRVSLEPLKLEQLDLNRVVQQVVQDLDLVIEQKNAHVRIGPLPTVEGHAHQLQQVFRNLLSNALKFQPNGNRPVVQVQAHLLSSKELPFPAVEGEYCHLIEVSDNGIGFPPDQSAAIFQVFYRLHSQSVYDGAGIGLSVAERIIHNHKGRILAQSEEGKGASFRVYLPKV